MAKPIREELKEKMLAELAISREMVSDGLEVTPRFRVLVADCDYQLITPMYDDMEHRLSRLSLVKSFILWRGASGFIHSGESIEPNAVVCSLVTAEGVLSIFQLITRDQTKKPPHHVSFAQMEGTAEVDPLLVELLPRPGEQLTTEQMTEAESLFGEGGAFEIKPILH